MTTAALNVPPVEPREFEDRPHEEPLESANRVRIQLLGRRYAKKTLTDEENARLEISSAKVAALAPSVTPEDLESLEAIVRRTDEISARLKARLDALDELAKAR